MALWAEGNTPTGSVHNLGFFKKDMGEEKTDLHQITDIIEKPKSFTGHSRRSSLVLNLQDARRPMHNILMHDNSTVDLKSARNANDNDDKSIASSRNNLLLDENEEIDSDNI